MDNLLAPVALGHHPAKEQRRLCGRGQTEGRLFSSASDVAGTHHARAHNLDNLKEGVLTPDIYDPALNPLYRDVLAHYGVVALPCRVGDPGRKGKVEAGVGTRSNSPTSRMRRCRLPNTGIPSRTTRRETELAVDLAAACAK